MDQVEFDQRAIAVIRGLGMDMPNAAASGHQGTAMALAPLAHVLFSRVMTYDPDQPQWPDRDRFILSNGHASALQYAMLYLAGYGLELDDLRNFRQWGSNTPGHPEAGHTVGVEVTTGPLGQGFGNGVGMGIAENYLRGRFGTELCDHHTFVFCGDGDLSEGLSHEAASLAGHLGLGRLVYVYDNNHITIDGTTELSLSDDPVGRFKAYGWHVEDVGEEADDLDALEAALRGAMDEEARPSMIVLRTHIAFPSPDAVDTPEAHGYSLKDPEIARTKEIIGIPVDETFWTPTDLVDEYRRVARRNQPVRQAWEERRAGYTGDVEAYEACLAGRGIDGWTTKLPKWEPGESVATRKASGKCLAAMVDVVPGLIGGAADLTGNTGTTLPGVGDQSSDDPAGRQIYFGVREHAMGAALNGMALHGGTVPIGGTFMVFSDYMRPAVRLAALSKAPSIFVWSHDSVGVGEDGPTHQPVEQLAALRAIPGLCVIRPADANEVPQAWQIAVDRDGPTALILSRQDLPVLDGTAELTGVARGAYTLVDTATDPDVVLVASGSEVWVCVEASGALAADGIHARVVSMPSWDLFELADADHRTATLPESVPTLAVEAGIAMGWDRYADEVVSIDRFGASAPGDVVLEKLGIEPGNVADRARDLIRRRKDAP